jgi:hypothetical protein
MKKQQYQKACSLARRAARKQGKIAKLISWCNRKNMLASIRLEIADKLVASQLLDIIIPSEQPWKNHETIKWQARQPMANL